MSPGHPLLEACISLVMERDLGREPRLLFCLEHGLKDGRRTRSDQQPLISNRLQFLEISRSGDVNPAGSAPYLEYRPLPEVEQPLAPQHLEEVKRERLERIARAEREIRARMQRQINHWSRRYAELQLQAEAQITAKVPNLKGGAWSSRQGCC